MQTIERADLTNIQFSTPRPLNRPGDPSAALRLLLAPVAEGTVGLCGAESKQFGMPAAGTQDAAFAQPYLLWSGWVPGSCGAFWIPSLFRSAAVKRIVVQGGDAVSKMRAHRTGLQDADIGLVTAVWGECDDGSMADQLQALADLEAATGIRPGIACLSGDTDPATIARVGANLEHVRRGKSLHTYLLLDAPVSTMAPDQYARWQHAIRAYCVAIGGDPAAVNVGRLMRLPGAIGTQEGASPSHGIRLQSTLWAEDNRKSVEQYDDLLTKYVLDTWGVSVEDGFAALQVSARLRHLAKHEMSFEIDCVADRVRDSRGKDQEAMAEALVILAVYGRSASVSVPGSSRATSPVTGTVSPDTVIRLATGRTGAIAAVAAMVGPGGKVRCHCPVHAEKTPSATLLVGADGTIRLKCHSAACGGLWRVESPTAAGTGFEFIAIDEEPIQDSTDVLDDLVFTEPEDFGPHPLESVIAPLRARVQARHDAAAKLDPLIGEMTRVVVDERGKELAPRMIQHLRDQGFVRTRQSCQGGPHLIGTDVEAPRLSSWRPACRSYSCPVCGPGLLARKAAAIADMPIILDDEIVGLPLAARTVYEVSIPRTGVGAWVRAFRRSRKEMSDFAPKEDGSVVGAKSDIRGSGQDAYVLFDPQDGGNVTVWSTVPVGVRGSKPRTIVGGADAIRARAARMVCETYQRDPSVDGVPMLRGHVSSSQGLVLRPDSLYRMAHPSTWAVVVPDAIAPDAVTEALKDEKVQVRQRKDAEGEVTGVTVGGISDVATWDRVVELLRSEDSTTAPPSTSTTSITALVEGLKQMQTDHDVGEILDAMLQTW